MRAPLTPARQAAAEDLAEIVERYERLPKAERAKRLLRHAGVLVAHDGLLAEMLREEARRATEPQASTGSKRPPNPERFRPLSDDELRGLRARMHRIGRKRAEAAVGIGCHFGTALAGGRLWPKTRAKVVAFIATGRRAA